MTAKNKYLLKLSLHTNHKLYDREIWTNNREHYQLHNPIEKILVMSSMTENKKYSKGFLLFLFKDIHITNYMVQHVSITNSSYKNVLVRKLERLRYKVLIF